MWRNGSPHIFIRGEPRGRLGTLDQLEASSPDDTSTSSRRKVFVKDSSGFASLDSPQEMEFLHLFTGSTSLTLVRTHLRVEPMMVVYSSIVAHAPYGSSSEKTCIRYVGYITLRLTGCSVLLCISNNVCFPRSHLSRDSTHARARVLVFLFHAFKLDPHLDSLPKYTVLVVLDSRTGPAATRASI